MLSSCFCRSLFTFYSSSFFTVILFPFLNLNHFCFVVSCVFLDVPVGFVGLPFFVRYKNSWCIFLFLSFLMGRFFLLFVCWCWNLDFRCGIFGYALASTIVHWSSPVIIIVLGASASSLLSCLEYPTGNQSNIEETAIPIPHHNRNENPKKKKRIRQMQSWNPKINTPFQ